MQKIIPSELPVEWLYVPDMVYEEIGGVQRRVQLIFPLDDSGKKYPLTVFVPGAAWHRQEMYNKIPTLTELAKRGTVVAAVQVRESDIATFPAQISDVEAAVHFLLEHAEQFHIDPERVFLMGDSSGAHISLMTMLTTRDESLRCHLKGCVDLSGPTDLLLCAAEPAPEGMFPNGRPTEILLGVRDLNAHPEEARRASSGMYISETKLPPVLILHGDADSVVSVEHSRQLHRQLTQKGHDAQYYEIAGAGHGGMAFWSGEALDIIADFITG